MMKFFIPLVCAVICTVSCAPTNRRLLNELLEFLPLFPIEDIYDLTAYHFENDEEFRAGINYLQSDEFRNKVNNLNAKGPIKKLHKVLLEIGVDAVKIDNIIRSSTKFLHTSDDVTGKKSFGKYLDKLTPLIPVQDLMIMHNKKKNESPLYKQAYDFLRSEKVYKLVTKILKLKETSIIASGLESMDIKLGLFLEGASVLFDWDLPKIEMSES